MRTKLGGTVFVLAAVAAVAFWWIFRTPSSNSKTDLAQVAQQALALTESLDADQAAPKWALLQQTRPDDVELLQNIAVNRVLDYASRVQLILGGTLTDAEASAMRQTLTGIYENGERDIQSLRDKDPNRLAVHWLTAQLTYQRSKLLPAVMANGIQRDLSGQLIQSIAQQPAPELLGMLLEFTETAGLEELDLPVTESTKQVAKTVPRNLCVMAELAKRQLRQKATEANLSIEQLVTLCDPMSDELQRQIGKPLKEFVEDLKASMAAQDWSTAEARMQSWINVMTATQAWRTDQHRLHPHLLDFIVLRPVYDQIAGTVNAIESASLMASDFENAAVRFKESTQQSIRNMITADVDLDEQDEWITIGDQGLIVWKMNEGELEVFAKADCDPDATLLVWADLFMVDSGAPERLKASRSGLSQEELQRLSNVHDTFVSLVVAGHSGVQVWRVVPTADSPDQRLVTPAKPTGMESVMGVTALSRGDVEGDGDLDLVLGTESGLEIWINRGNMTFYAIEAHSQLPKSNSPVVDIAIGDVDRDIDLDFLTVQSDGTVGYLENLLHQQFRWGPLQNFSDKKNRRVAIAELDGDVSWDAVVMSDQQIVTTKTATMGTGQWEIQSVDKFPVGGKRFQLVDFDLDSWLDLLVCDDQSLRLHQGKSPGTWSDQPIELVKEGTQAVHAVDADGDGKREIVYVTMKGQLGMVRSKASVGHSVAVRYRGIDDNATGRVNHYAIGSTVEVWFDHRYRAMVVDDRTTYFGLGNEASAETIRAVLTNGITQHVIKPPVDTVLNEIQVLKGSCPYLYAWNGTEMGFVTDCLWGAPLGLQVAPGKVIPDRPWEYLLVPGRCVQSREGQYAMSITEELWEVTYLDHVELTAVDHPAGTQVYTNEKVGPPSVAEQRLYAFDTLKPVVKALDLHGVDVSRELAKVDGQFAADFKQRVRQGLTPLHGLELDFGPIQEQDRVVMVLTGWLMPTDTSLNLQIDQNPDLTGVAPPSIWVPEGDFWKQAIPFMGFPGGKTKTIVVDLTETLDRKDPRIQIRTSGEFYWDAVGFAVNPPEIMVKTQPVRLMNAELVWHGFGDLLPRESNEPHRYHYDSRQLAPLWPPLSGSFTRFGDVQSLLQSWDDRMVVMGPGDEVKLVFEVPKEPAPEGWVRDFVLHNVGWDKDADLNTLAGQSAGPLPFRDMSAYPPADADHEKSLQQQRMLDGVLTRRARFRSFWKRGFSQGKPAEEKGIETAFVDRRLGAL